METHVTQTDGDLQSSQTIQVSPVLRYLLKYWCAVPEVWGRPLAPLAPADAGAVAARIVGGCRR